MTWGLVPSSSPLLARPETVAQGRPLGPLREPLRRLHPVVLAPDHGGPAGRSRPPSSGGFRSDGRGPVPPLRPPPRSSSSPARSPSGSSASRGTRATTTTPTSGGSSRPSTQLSFSPLQLDPKFYAYGSLPFYVTRAACLPPRKRLPVVPLLGRDPPDRAGSSRRSGEPPPASSSPSSAGGSSARGPVSSPGPSWPSPSSPSRTRTSARTTSRSRRSSRRPSSSSRAPSTGRPPPPSPSRASRPASPSRRRRAPMTLLLPLGLAPLLLFLRTRRPAASCRLHATLPLRWLTSAKA